ncbi:MAG TPA: hypothetical protein VGH62_09930 [Bradyrhizobium sp.]|jgi:hypothetical protein
MVAVSWPPLYGIAIGSNGPLGQIIGDARRVEVCVEPCRCPGAFERDVTWRQRRDAKDGEASGQQ